MTDHPLDIVLSGPVRSGKRTMRNTLLEAQREVELRTAEHEQLRKLAATRRQEAKDCANPIIVAHHEAVAEQYESMLRALEWS